MNTHNSFCDIYTVSKHREYKGVKISLFSNKNLEKNQPTARVQSPDFTGGVSVCRVSVKLTVTEKIPYKLCSLDLTKTPQGIDCHELLENVKVIVLLDLK